MLCSNTYILYYMVCSNTYILDYMVQGVSKKKCTRLIFIISPAINMLEGCDISHLKLYVNSGGIRFQHIRLSITLNMIPHIVLLISQLSDIAQKSFCTSDGADMDLTFQMSCVPAF